MSNRSMAAVIISLFIKILTQKKYQMHAEFRLITFMFLFIVTVFSHILILTNYQMTETVDFLLRTKPLKHLFND